MRKFLEFLYDWESPDANLLKQDLASYGVDIQRVEAEVSKIVQSLDCALNPPWLMQAREKQKQFEQVLEKYAREIDERFKSSRDFIDAVLNGRFGANIQAQATVFFRNRDCDEISEDDLKLFLEECQVLERL